MKNKTGHTPPRFGQWLLKKIIDKEISYEALGDFHEIFYHTAEQEGKHKAVLWYWVQVIKSLYHFFTDTMYWRIDMFKNYVKIAYRNIMRHKGYSFINITGLAIGIASILLIALYVNAEYSFDQYHKDSDRIYRVALDWQTKSSTHSYAANVPPLGPAIKENFPQVEKAARALYLGFTQVVKGNDKTFYENAFLYADPEIFKVLTIPFIKGDTKTALNNPASVVINEDIAAKYFEGTEAYGKTLNMDGLDYKITGIIKNAPDNTHFQYTMFLLAKPLERMNWMFDWTWPGAYTYIKLAPNTDISSFEKQLSKFNNKYIKKLPGGNMGKYINTLQPVADIHLYSNLEYEFTAPGNTAYLLIFSIIGLFIIAIAAINFMNLTTARSSKRAKEVGMRKVIGADRRQLIGQFLGESTLISLIALLLSLVIVYFTLPLFNNMAGTKFIFANLMQPFLIISAILVTLFIGLLAGIYPALFLTAFNPVSVLKGVINSGIKGFMLRRVLVVGQFSISILLIIGTIIVYKQLNFMKNQDLGFDKEQKMVITAQRRSNLNEKYEAVKNLLLTHPAITAASASGEVPGCGAGSMITGLIGEQDDKKQMMYYNTYDHDFINQYKIELAAGRSFDKEMSTDKDNACLINEAAVKAFGWNSAEEALGKHLKEGIFGLDKEIIGVTKNFHYRSLQIAVEPLVMQIQPAMFSNISLTFNAESIKDIIPFVEDKWAQLFPGQPLNYFFLDADFDKQYFAEEQIGKIVSVMAFLGIFIASLGLLGLSAFATEQRTKEIGIRKVLGSSSSGIVGILSKEFLKLVVLGNIIAWPAAYFVMNNWLQNFAYRTNISLWIFIISGISALIIALITVSLFSVKAALANPVEALKYE